MRRRNTKTREPVRFTAREREYAFSVAMKYVKDEDEAADVAQDALLNAYRHRKSFRGDSQYTTWLYRVAATTALMHLRKKRRLMKHLSLSPVPETADDDTGHAFHEPSDPGPSPEDCCAAREAVRLAETRLAEMGDKYADIFAMRFGRGYTEPEIARQLDLNVATVKTRAYRARAAIRSRLEEAGLEAVAG